MKRYISLILLLIICGCDPIDNKIELSNRSPGVIFYSTSANDSIKSRSPLLNAYRVSQNDTIWDDSGNLVLRDSSKFLTITGKHGWENYINKRCKDSTLRLFIFNKELINRVPWDTIIVKRLFSKKLSYKVKDLEKLNWRVEYKK